MPYNADWVSQEGTDAQGNTVQEIYVQVVSTVRGQPIAIVGGLDQRQHAARIVKAVNGHDSLVKALQRMVDVFEKNDDTLPFDLLYAKDILNRHR